MDGTLRGDSRPRVGRRNIWPVLCKGEDDAHVHTQAKVEAFVLISSYEVLKFYFDCMEARYENDKQDNDVI